MEKYNTHIVQSNDTIKSVSSLYGINKDDLLFFHNNHCPAKDHILIEISNQKELFIPRYAVADKSKLVELSSGNKLTFKPENIFVKYGVSIKIENGDKISEIKYDASVRWMKTENNLHYFEIDRLSKIFINEEEVNEIADLLAYKTSKVLYPLKISVDFSGKFNSVENLTAYNQRWEQVKEEVYKEFEGETVDDYIEKIEKILNEPDILTLLLKNDYFIRTLFFGIYQNYGSKYQIIGEEGFPVVKNSIEPNYEIKLEIDPIKDDYSLINIEGQGKLKDERSIEDFINENPFKLIVDDEPTYNDKGEFRLQFYLNEKTSFPESVYLECSLMLDEEKKVSISIADVEQ